MTKLMIGTKEYRSINIKEMQNWTLDKKINHALKRIREFHEVQKGKTYISFSGGKDSTVLLHLVRSLYPDTIAVFSNTTNEYSEILKFVKETKNVITINPKMTFNETIVKFGFPLVSKKTARAITDLRENKSTTKNVRNLYLTGLNRKGVYCPTYKLAKKWYPLFEEVDFNITNKCCDILKKEPMIRFKKETGLKSYVGTQVSEGGYRKQSWLDSGCNIINGTNDDISRPLSIFTEKDIWEYIKRFSIPYSTIYDDLLDADGKLIVKGEVRTGCSYCAFGAHLENTNLFETNRFQRLKIRKPKQFEKIMNLKNNGVKFVDALNFIGINF